MKKLLAILFLLFPVWNSLSGQEKEKSMTDALFREALTDRTAYENLRTLCKSAPGRVTGSEAAARAVLLTRRMMEEMGLDSVYLQPVSVPRWVRGKKEEACIRSSSGEQKVSVTALGMSVGTGAGGITAGVVEVAGFSQLDSLGSKGVAGKIVFFNRPMDPALPNPFTAYGQAGDQRTQGPARAAVYGAVGVVVRSLTTALDNFPHTGVTRYAEGVPQIPAVAISTLGAGLLSRRLREDPGLSFWFRTDCMTHPEVISANVIGEIRGSHHPEQIITVGGHLDAWDPGEGAHDDGAGCIQSMEVLRLFRKLGIRPKRTLRAVMFMDEEIAQRGAAEYARQAGEKQEQHYFALESDRGALVPVAIGVSTTPEKLEKFKPLLAFFEPYGITRITAGGGGVDIAPLRRFGTPLASVIPDPQRYFDYHHSANDTFEQVNIRELQLGSAAMAALVYLVDRYDL